MYLEEKIDIFLNLVELTPRQQIQLIQLVF